ncbi:MAG TPA: pyruvate formate lyase family protein [Kiritimatiellia bacterium]|nr:pyruvate formate lyase family protein [Kiritimatiellia bacterium]HRU71616.1 pyruvate formate lyase family protein [Kiritimatiellia bacterium]
MTPRIQALRDFILAKRHAALRRDVDWQLAERFSRESTAPERRAAEGLRAMLAAEQPAFLPGERIAFLRTVKQIPDLYTPAEMEALRRGAYYHEKGCVFNISPDYATTIRGGLDARRAEIASRLQRAEAERDDAAIAFLTAALSGVEAVLDLAERYRAAAQAQGLTEIAQILARVPRQGATTFHEALQFLRILHYTLWCEGEYHNGLGRFDQYMWPYCQADLAAGRLTAGEALELIEEFFLSCNRDSDLYIGVQQGDNGQSLMLGGAGRDGKDAFNELSRLCLKASCELAVIDPKINLRVNANTPLDVLEAGTELTSKGLGFPQYANDDVVIPALVKHGYAPEDARDYTVAACWEFIIPGCGMDIPNIGAVSFPAVVDHAMRTSQAATFEAFMADVRAGLMAEADRLSAAFATVKILPGPFVSILCDGRVAAGRDVCEGNRYNNFGIHGTGLSTAADSLAAIRQLVFEEHALGLRALAAAVDSDFAGQPELLAKVRFNVPKMGNAESSVDQLGKELLNAFADSWVGRKNGRGGIYRCGTGSAMYYIWHAKELHATPDGRLTGQPFAANYAPSLNVPVKGPVSVIESFTVPDLGRVINGGPLTIEIHDSAFRERDGITKVAQLVKYFIDRSGHQLQLNAINRDQLRDAQAHPEAHRNLIVRVWGWSGYFIELDKPYQDHIIQRVELAVS